MWPAFGGPCEAQPYPSAQPHPAEYGYGDPGCPGCPGACPWAGACPGARYSLPSLPPSLPAGTVMGEEDYEAWPSMHDSLPPAAELGPHSQRGGAASHRAQSFSSQLPNYDGHGAHSSAPGFQQRL